MWYRIILAVACGAVFDTGERLEVYLAANDRLDAAIKAEAMVDKSLDRPNVEYSHAVDVIPLNKHVTLALAA
jgi:hypothetical protein